MYYLSQMKKCLVILTLLSINTLFAQRHVSQVMIDPLDIPEFKPTGDPSATIKDLQLWYCGNFYVDMPTLVRCNKDINTLDLRISGGEILNFGRANEFLIKSDTSGGIHEVLLEFQEMTVKAPILSLPDPIMRLRVGGQLVDGGMMSINTAKSTNVIEFVGEYVFDSEADCYPILPQMMVEGQVELISRGKSLRRYEFEATDKVDITEMLEVATPGSQLVVTQKVCLMDGPMLNYRFPAIFTAFVLIN